MTDTNSLNDTKIPNTISLANINAEVDTALDTAISELSQGAPTNTPTVRTALMLMYMAMINKLDVQTSGTDALEIHNAAGTRIAQKLIKPHVQVAVRRQRLQIVQSDFDHTSPLKRCNFCSGMTDHELAQPGHARSPRRAFAPHSA